MEKRAFIPLTLVALFIAALFRLPVAGVAESQDRVQPTERSKASAGHLSGARRQASDEDADADALDLLGESYGVPVDTTALVRRVRRSVDSIKATPDERQEGVAYLKDFFGLSLPEDVPSVKKAVATVKAIDSSHDVTPESVKAAVEGFLSAYFAERRSSAAGTALADAIARVNKTSLKLKVLKNIAAKHHSRVRFLIATLPDPVDSYTGWQFDPMLDVITQAIAQSDYVLDRFYFPDVDVEKEPASVPIRRRHAHEERPSVVVFRRHLDGTRFPIVKRAQWPDRLVLLIVYENPVAGVHPRALTSAVRLVTRWNTPTDHDPVMILGPTFSGSSNSIARALEMLRLRNVTERVRIVSGSATDAENVDTLKLDDNVSFQATVNPDSILLPTLLNEIQRMGLSRRVAALYEANTQYGRQLKELLEHKRPELPPFIQLPFPMNMSRLRTTVQRDKDGAFDQSGLPLGLRPLPMEEAENPADKIPQFFPKTTSAYIELQLSRVLQAMRQEHVGTVALLATDSRDKLYLAQQVARYSPDVTILTAESDSLYIHPDYSRYLQGAIVASTYPLYSGNQRWSSGFVGSTLRRHFANGSAQGIYNATLALLNYDEQGRPNDAKAPPLVEYGMPGKQCPPKCLPPIWISVIGRNSALPIRAYAVESTAKDYVFPMRHGELVTSGTLATFPTPLFNALFTLSTFAIATYWLFARSAWTKPANRRRMLTAPSRHHRQLVSLFEDAPADGRLSFLVCLGGIAFVEMFVVTICVARLRTEWSGWALAAMIAVSLCLAVLADLARRVIVPFVTYDLRDQRRLLDPAQTRTWLMLTIVALCGWGLWNLVAYEWSVVSDTEAATAVAFVARAVDSSSGGCPTLPVLFLGAGFSLWGFIELARLRSPHGALTDPAVQGVVQQTVNGGILELKGAWDFLNRSTLAVPVRLLAIAGLAAAATCAFAFDPIVAPLVTAEGREFGRFVSAALLLLQFMVVLSLLQLVFLWASLRQLLDGMGWHRMASAYDHVPRELFPKGLFFRVPRPMELQAPVALASIPRIAATFERDMRQSPRQSWSETSTWTALVEVASSTEVEGQPVVTTGPAVLRISSSGPVSIGNVAIATRLSSSMTHPFEHVPDAEHRYPLVAMAMAFVIRDALGRLGYNLVFVIGGVLLMFCSHALFPFQARQQLAALGWTYIGLTFAAILTVLVQMKRNDVIGRLTSPEPGKRPTWDGEFVLKLTVFGLLPVLTLFAAQFPEVGGTILRWLEPVQKALP